MLIRCEAPCGRAALKGVTVPARPELYLRSYPIPEGMDAHAASVEEDGWDGLLFTDTQNLSMDVFASLYHEKFAQ